MGSKFIQEISRVASSVRQKEMKREYHTAPRGLTVLTKAVQLYEIWSPRDGRATDMYLKLFDVNVGAKSEEEGGRRGQGFEGEDSRGKTC